MITTRDRFEFVARLAAPYVAVAIFWVVLHNAWLAILAYHAQILWWSRGGLPALTRPRWTPLTLLVLVSAMAAPILYVLLPYVTDGGLAPWLARYGLAGASLGAMVFYYGVVHPVLEQTHWAPLREATPLAHFAFAGYHMLVLYTLLPAVWMAACFVVLVAASWTWQRMEHASGSLVVPIASHMAADLGMVVVAWLLT